MLVSHHKIIRFDKQDKSHLWELLNIYWEPLSFSRQESQLAWQAILVFIINIYKKNKNWATLWRASSDFVFMSLLIIGGKIASCITSSPSSLSNMTFNMAHAKQVIIRVKKMNENSRKYDYRIVSHGTMEKRQLFHKDTGLSNAANHCLVYGDAILFFYFDYYLHFCLVLQGVIVFELWRMIMAQHLSLFDRSAIVSIL